MLSLKVQLTKYKELKRWDVPKYYWLSDFTWVDLLHYLARNKAKPFTIGINFQSHLQPGPNILKM